MDIDTEFGELLSALDAISDRVDQWAQPSAVPEPAPTSGADRAAAAVSGSDPNAAEERSIRGAAASLARERGLTGWKVQSELPNPVNFDAATTWVTPEHMREAFGCGPDTARHLAVAQPFVDAGYDHLALINAGPDVDGFFDQAAAELIAAVRGLTPAASRST